MGEVRVQDGVAGVENQKPRMPRCPVDGEGEGHGGLWGAALTCSTHLCGFAAKHLVVGLGLPLVNRVNLDRFPRHRMEESEDNLEPAGISTTSVTISNHDDSHPESSGCCFTFKSYVNSSFTGCNSKSYRKGILGIPTGLLDTEQTVTTWNNSGS